MGLSFQPNPNHILAVLTACDDIDIFSVNYSPRYPKNQRWLRLSNSPQRFISCLIYPLCGLVFDPSDTSKLLLYGQHTAIYVDLSLPIPIEPKQLSIHSLPNKPAAAPTMNKKPFKHFDKTKRKHDSLSESTTAPESSNFCMATIFRSIAHATFLSDSRMVRRFSL